MPRRARQDLEDALHHVYARGNDGRIIFFDDADCQVYLVILRGVIRVYGWRVLSYCLMSNHVHLLIETTEANLGAGMQRLHGHYGRFFNMRHDTWGHVFRKPYGNKRIETDEQLFTVAGYIAANPVAARLCARPELWRRSSHASAMGTRVGECHDRERLLWRLDGLGGYAACVEAALARAVPAVAG